jgi:hypothetical protein
MDMGQLDAYEQIDMMMKFDDLVEYLIAYLRRRSRLDGWVGTILGGRGKTIPFALFILA